MTLYVQITMQTYLLCCVQFTLLDSITYSLLIYSTIMVDYPHNSQSLHCSAVNPQMKSKSQIAPYLDYAPSTL